MYKCALNSVYCSYDTALLEVYSSITGTTLVLHCEIFKYNLTAFTAPSAE